ncbi:hypothetical protein SUGI_1198930 [Cryptomeria japonica]|nr:hypothetical protein SUGI_1198930 [Cryptomeria japonica]
MAELTLREALKSLCSNNGWSYAVFWKLKSRNSMILTWEDGHYQSVQSSSFSNTSIFTSTSTLPNGWDTGGMLLNHGVHGQDGFSMEDQIGQLVANMSHQTHPFGEGTIGSIAFSGRHQWIFQENFLSGRTFLESLNGSSSFEYPDGWKNQFAAGIKTIAVIAAVPYGVVQLGSRQTIMEDLDFVRHVKTLFGSVHNVSRAFTQVHVQEFLSGGNRGIQPITGMKCTSLLDGISNQSIVKDSSSKFSEEGGDSFSILGLSKGSQAQAHALPFVCSSSILAKSLSQFSRLHQKGIQLSSPTPSLAHEQETFLKVTRAMPSARVIYPLQGMLQASSCKDGNRQSLFVASGTGNNSLELMEQQIVKEMELQRQLPRLLPINAQRKGQSNIQNNALSTFHEATFSNLTFDVVKFTDSDKIMHCNLSESARDEGMHKRVLCETGPSHISNLKQTDILSSFPALQDVCRQSAHSAASSVPLMHTNGVEGLDSIPLVELDNSCPAYKDSVFSSGTVLARHPHYDSWGMTSGQCESAIQEPVSNDLIPSLDDDFSIPATPGLGSQPWDKGMTTKGVLSFFQDLMVDNFCSEKESSNSSEAAFVEVLPGTDGCVPYAFDDPKSLTSGQESSINSTTLTATDELFDVLGSVSKTTEEQAIWDDISLPVSHASSGNFISHSFGASAGSACPSEVDISQNFDTSIDRQLEKGIFCKRKSEHLLDAVVAKILLPVNHNADDNTSSKISFSRCAPSVDSASVKATSCFSGPLSGSEQSKCADLSHCKNNADIKSVQNSLTSGAQGEALAKRSPNNSDLKTQLGSWFEDSRSAKIENLGPTQSKKSDETVKVNKKRAKPGESSRPRPKDRQQIQDRVKELREIVPNGTKCSIDALLERTIKHMLFLQSVTKHADKLKQSCEPKVLDKDRGFLGKGYLEGGTSWAVEVGGQSMACPIIVENMSQPRQMLIEMVCEKQGLFLEIADVIRGLGLTILKGFMEAHNDMIWARFAVEANKEDSVMLINFVQLL